MPPQAYNLNSFGTVLSFFLFLFIKKENHFYQEVLR